MTTLKITGLVIDFVSAVFLVGIVLLAVVIVSSNSSVFFGYKSFVVLSGSMEPSIRIGDLVVVHQQIEYLPHDVITFNSENGHIVTHRVVSNNGGSIVTKGDANRTEDDGLIEPRSIIGRVVFSVPQAGRLVGYAKSPFGILLLIAFPVLGLMGDQLLKFKNAK